MAAPSRTVLLIPPFASGVTATGTSNQIVVPELFTSFIAYLNVVYVSGTTATLNVRLQNGFRDKGTSTQLGQDQKEGDQVTGSLVWDDLAAFAQATTASGSQVMRVVGGGNTVNAISQGALAASTIRSGPIGSIIRAQWTAAGTNPVYTGTYLLIQFIP